MSKSIARSARIAWFASGLVLLTSVMVHGRGAEDREAGQRLFRVRAIQLDELRAKPSLPEGFGVPRATVVNDGSRLYILGPAGRTISEATPDGTVIAVHDLRGLGLADARALALAPTGDPTDDPDRRSLYVLDQPEGTAGRLVELEPISAEQQAQATAIQATVDSFQSSLLRDTDTSLFQPPSPDPSGVAYMGPFGRLLIADGEVEETPHWAGANLFEVTLTGALRDTADATSFTFEPVGAAFNPANWHLFISDDDAKRVFEIDPGPDGLFLTGDDTVTWFSTTAFGCFDPEGLAYDTLRGYLYISDGEGREVYEIRPGPDGLFSGVPPEGDDEMSHFDLFVLGLLDTEGIEHNPEIDRLYVLDRGTNSVVELTTAGTLTRTIDISAAGAITPAGLATGPSSFDPTQRSLYIVDRGLDNDSHPTENDGRLYEMSLPGLPPPPGQTALDVRVASGNDDGEERPSGKIALTSNDLDILLDGTVVMRAVGLRFNGVSVPRGSRIVSAYLQFKADEATGDVTSLTIQGQNADNAPAFTTATANISSRPRSAAAVSWSPLPWTTVGQAGPDQRTPDLSAIIQQVVDRPGWVAGNSMAMIITGSGRRVADAFEGGATAAPLLRMVFEPPAGGNVPPIAAAGADQTVNLASGALLSGSVSDDGLPNPLGLVTVEWSQIAGPGTATLADPLALATAVTFTIEGIYTLRLMASDSLLSGGDDVIITVVGPTTVFSLDRRVAAGSDDAEQRLSGTVYLDTGDLDMMLDGTAAQSAVGLRFANVTIPQGATIVDASIQFTADEISADATTLTIRGEDADNAAPFAALANNISSRPLTTASSFWSPPDWTTVGQAGSAEQTPGLAAVIQQIVGRPGWVEGNALSIIITGSGKRVAESYEGFPAGAPLLHVLYQAAGGNRPPSANAGVDQVITLAAGALLNGSVSDDGLPDPPATVSVGWTQVSGPGMATFSSPLTVDTAVTFPAAGTYTIRLTADDGALTASDDVIVTVIGPGTPGFLDVRVTAALDDAEERQSGTVYVDSGDLDFMLDGTAVQAWVGLRFTGIAIPPGSTIVSAWIQLTADEVWADPTTLTIFGQDDDNPVSFAALAGNISSRPRTAASVAWSPPAWTAVGLAGPDQRTPDLGAVIQQIVSRPGWAGGSAMVFVITGSGQRVAEAFEGGATLAPLLHVEYLTAN